MRKQRAIPASRFSALRNWRAALLLVVPLGGGGCASAPHPAHETLQSTIWIQNAAEYHATTRQLFAVAHDQLERALADSTWSALGQSGEQLLLPPAIILDVDETVLDNSGYHARMVLDDGSHDRETWAQWVEAAAARPLPGAVEFLDFAKARGVAIYYVTNRDQAQEEATRRNLLRAGFPLDDSQDVVLTVGESGWTKDKEARRRHVASRYRVLLLLGDDLNDFVFARGVDPTQRRALVESNASKWGHEWILLPNQNYGSWEGGLNLPPGSRRETLRHKRRLLRPFDGSQPQD